VGLRRSSKIKDLGGGKGLTRVGLGGCRGRERPVRREKHNQGHSGGGGGTIQVLKGFLCDLGAGRFKRTGDHQGARTKP